MKYSEKDLVAFGNFLLSDERKNNIVHVDNLNKVTDADLSNFKDSKWNEALDKYEESGVKVARTTKENSGS